MIPKHTPWPWSLSGPTDGEDEWAIWANQAPPGARMPALCFGPDAEWNAKLMVQSPRLADKLEEALAVHEMTCADGDCILSREIREVLSSAGRLP